MVRVLLLLCLLATSMSSLAQATATLDRNVISDNETVTLSIVVNESKLFASPDIGVLEKDFAIINQHKNSRSQWINGQSSSSTEWHYTLAPRHAGVITIPPVQIGKYTTAPLSLQVKPARHSSGSSHDPIFIEVGSHADQVYVQQQLLLTVRINYAVQVSNLEMTPLDIDQARVEEVSNSRYERQINNNPYITHEIVYAIFPQQSGELTIPAITVTASIPRTQLDAMLRQGEQKRFRSEPISVTVQPAAVPGEWLPASSLTVTDSWSGDPQQLAVGQSITRTITTTVTGMLAEQLPDIVMDEQPGLRIYREKPDFDNQRSNTGLSGTRTDRFTLVATAAGQMTLPAITINWWDLANSQAQQARLPGLDLVISAATTPQPDTSAVAPAQPAAGHSGETPAATTDSHNSAMSDTRLLWPWQLATALLSALVIILVVILFATRRTVRPADPPTPVTNNNDVLQRQFRKACASGRPATIRHTLLQWMQARHAGWSIHSLADIGRRYADPELEQWLKKLDASLYHQDNTACDWMAFYALLLQHEQRDNTTDTRLYPTR